MNISNQLKKYRKSYGLSQEKLAEVIHVSRQTISNWETGKSYPDLQSLLLLSDQFNISLDELIKGDVDSMKRKVTIAKMNQWMLVLVVSSILTLITAPLFKYWGDFALILPVTFIIIIFYAAVKLQKIQDKENLKTYKQILDYMENKEVRYDPKTLNKKRMNLEKSGLAIIGALIGFISMYVVLSIF